MTDFISTTTLPTPPHTVDPAVLLVMIKNLDEKITLLISSQREEVKTAMSAAEKAVQKAEDAANKRFEALNELRDMAADWRTEFARASTVDLQIKSLNDKVDALTAKSNENVGRGTGRSDIWGFIVGGAGVMAAIVALWSKH